MARAIFSGSGFPRGKHRLVFRSRSLRRLPKMGRPSAQSSLCSAKRWHHDEGLQEPGEHRVVLADHVLIDVMGARVHTKLDAFITVERRHYIGPLPVKMVGFRDEQNQSFSTGE